jgi:DNA-binding LacI/PurR family transcriptional regulator
VVQGVLATAEEAGYRTFIIPGQTHAQPEDEYVRILREGHVDGLVVLVRPANLQHIARLAESGLPAVAIDDGLLRPNLPSVRADNHGGARIAVEHLLGLGHRRIAHIAGPSVFGCSHEREAGYRAALATAGLGGAACVVEGGFERPGGLHAAEEMLGMAQPPTAIFCANDVTALAVLEIARRHGLRAGRDLAVIGFDDTRAAEAADPPLTTVHQPLVDFGRRAGQMLVARLQGTPSPVRHEVLGCRLVVRSSCGARAGVAGALG